MHEKKNVIIIIKTFSFLGKDVQERRLNHFRNEIVAVSTKKKKKKLADSRKILRLFFLELAIGFNYQMNNDFLK